MGTNWSNEFSTETSKDKYFISEVNTDKITGSFISEDWNLCKDFIIDTYKSLKILEDNDVVTLNDDLKINGWVERTYENHGIVRGSIRGAKKIYIEILYDNVENDDIRTVKSENIIDKFNDDVLRSVIKELISKVIDQDLSFNDDDDVIDILKMKRCVRSIQGDPLYYIMIKMIIE